MLNKFFETFEGECNPYPLAVFRIGFFSGIILHFFPSLLWLHENYSSDAYRTRQWNQFLFDLFELIPQPLIVILAILTMAACIAALLGFHTRWAIIASGVGLYAFSSFNSINNLTLAVTSAWATLTIWSFTGGGGEVLSLDSLRGRGAAVGKRVTRNIILFQLMAGFFFAGIEKLITGWPLNNQMHILLAYPQGFVMRAWSSQATFLQGEATGMFLSMATVFIELTIPFWLLWRRTQLAALLAYELFFAGIIIIMEVPPLFLFIFSFGALLAVDDSTVSDFIRKLRNGSPLQSRGVE